MLILGSLSPRRKEILSFYNLPFVQKPSPFDEASCQPGRSAAKYVLKLAEKKGEALSPLYPQELILTCDTVVFFKGKILEKPKSRKDAEQMLQSLSGQWHTVYTAVSIRQGTKVKSAYETTRVLMPIFSQKALSIYLDTNEWSDKAGGYGIQNKGALLVKKIQGCFYNVMGFPVQTVAALLKEFHVDLWEYYPC